MDTAADPVTPGLLRVIGGAAGPELFGVRDAAWRGSDLVVLTSPEPALHLFSGDSLSQWGEEGEGPGELSQPSRIAVAGDRLLVKDGTAGAELVAYGFDGTFLSSRPLHAYQFVSDLQVAGQDALLLIYEFGSRDRALVRPAGERYDTVLTYRLPERVRLEAEGSPSLTIVPPFASRPVWTALPDGRVAFWDGRAPHLAVLNLEGDTVQRLSLPTERFQVTEADREAWFADAIPTGDFMGRGDVFAPLREQAGAEIEYPLRLPAVLALQADPEGDVWVERMPASAGELWTRVGAEGPGPSFRLPPGRELLAIGASLLAVRATDELDVETVEVYRRPR